MKALVLLLASFCLLWALPAGAAPTDAADRAALLQGVHGLIVPGGIPGDVAVFGAQAFPVVTSRLGKANLPVFAGARFGKGRVIVGGHESFFGGEALKNPDNATFAANIAHWVGGKAAPTVRVGLVGQNAALKTALSDSGCRATDLQVSQVPESLARLDVLWLNQSSLDGDGNAARVEAVRRWVQGGGGLIVTGPGWGWQMENSTRDLSRDQSGNKIVVPMGLAFGAGMLEGSDTQPLAVSPDTLLLSGANDALDALEAQAAGQKTLTPAQLSQATAVLGQALSALPPDQNAFARRVEVLCADKGGAIPTRQTPVTEAMPFARLKITLDAQKYRRLPADKVTADPSAASFPGAIPVGAPRETRTVTVDTHVPQWHGTGLYAAPGEVVTVTLPSSAVKKGLAVRIGSHTDTLWNLDKWERFPEITMARPLDASTVRIASPFGGMLFVVVPDNCTLGDVPVTIAHAVAAPRFVRGVTSLADWKQTIRNSPAPWAELQGNLVALSVPSSAVRTLDDPEALMAHWDDIMEHIYGFFAAPKRGRPERYNVDRQISAGYMHSGYPIMTGDDVANTFTDLSILNGKDAIKCWGFYHEMGHNFQQPEWTWKDFGEVTNNLFSLYGTETFNGAMVGGHPAMTADEMAKRVHLVAAAPGAERYYAKDPWYPLTMFWLMRHEFGWTPFTQLFAEFRALPDAQRPHTEMEKHDQFLTRFSKLTGHN
nr:M60 family metallopeptidase [Armatimonadota bacterium]